MKFAWILLGATACTAAAPAPPPPTKLEPALEVPAAAPSGAVVLCFDWPTQGSVQVRETTRKKGHTAEFSYTLAWSPDEQGGFVIDRLDYQCTAFDGAAVDAAVADLQGLAGIGEVGQPRFRISAAGELVELLDLESRVIEPLIARALQAPGIPDQEQLEIAEVMRSPGP